MFDALFGLVCVVILGVLIVAGFRGVDLLGRASHNAARCLGWCEAHGYDRAFHAGDPSASFDVAECYCAAPVGSDAALAPIDTETPDSAEEGAPE